MILNPSKIHLGAASDIQLRYFTFVKTAALSGATSLTVDDPSGLADGNAVTLEWTAGAFKGATQTVTASDVDQTTGVLTLAAGLDHDIGIEDTVLGPVAQTLGGTNGGITIAYRPEAVGLEYDQVKSQVDAALVGEEAEVRGNLAEMDLDQWAAVMAHGTKTTRVAASGITAATILSLGGDDFLASSFNGARIIVPRRAHSGLNIILDIFRVRNIEGIEMPFNKRDPSQIAFTLRGYADPRRTAGKQLMNITMETAAAL